MPDTNSFSDLLQRIRAGDDQAAADLVRQYEPEIRREVRLRLSDPRLYRVLDSMDICQSVLASFFVRAAAGQYELDRPEQLLRLLVAMARNKLAFQVRKERAQCRDNRRLSPGRAEELDLVAREASPSQVVAGKELLAEFRTRLSTEERTLAEMRAQGREWSDIAAELGGTAEGRRKQLARAIDRVAQQLGIDEEVRE